MHVLLPGVRCRFLRIFTFHQRKGGIHEIYRSFMDTFGWYRLTGVRSIKISADIGQEASRCTGGLLYSEVGGQRSEVGWSSMSRTSDEDCQAAAFN